MTEKELREMGVEDAQMRKAILNAMRIISNGEQIPIKRNVFKTGSRINLKLSMLVC